MRGTFMTKINIEKKISYLNSLLIPFKITPLYTAISIVNMIIHLILPPLEVVAIAKFVDYSIFAIQEQNSGVWKLSIIWLVVLIFIKAYGYLETPVIGRLNQNKIEKEWLAIDCPAIVFRAKLLTKYIENSDMNDLVARVSQPAKKLCGILNHSIDIVVFVGSIISYIIILLFNAPLFGSIILLSSVPIIFLAYKSAQAKYELKKDVTRSERLVATLNDYLENRAGASERNMFSYHDFIEKKLNKEYHYSRKRILRSDMKWEMRKSASGFLLILLCTAAIFLLLPDVSTGSVSVGMYISLVGYLFTAAEDIVYNLPNYIENIVNDKKFINEYNQYVELDRVPDKSSVLQNKSCDFERLEFKNVSFSYPGTDKMVLDDISLLIERGKHYSLIGINGSGKSTLIKLMLKCYDNYEGEIILNGVSLREWDYYEVYKMFFAVFQDFTHYDLSFSDNISVGKHMSATENEIDRAIELSDLKKEIIEFSEGKQTMIGTVYENGTELSGGQWQKIALARAIVNNACVKIFDEPTAALDPVAERNLYERFHKINSGVTTVFISHRLANCIHSDEIFVLKNGKISECGTHEELLKKKGEYTKMYNIQKEWYL